MSEPSEIPAAMSCIDGQTELPCTNTALRRAARQLGYLYDEAVASTGLKATQMGLMAQITAADGPAGPTLQALADRLLIQISALTHALRPLVRDGLVELRPDEQDKRTKHAVLTAAGRVRLDEAMALWSVANRRVERVLGPDAAQWLRSVADRIASPAFSDAYRALGDREAGAPSDD